MEDKNEQLNKDIISQIKDNKVEMRSRWFFLFRTILGILGAFLLSLCLIFMVSFIFFGLRKSGVSLAPGFGAQGFLLFMLSLPWVLILISVAFLIVLEVLIRKYSFAYRKPILYSLAGIVGLTTLICLVVPSFAFHNSIFKNYKPTGPGTGDQIPTIGRFYRDFGIPHPSGLLRGVVIDFSTGTLTIATDDGVTSSILINNFTKIFPGTDMGLGDELLVFGPKSTSGIVTAIGIREISD